MLVIEYPNKRYEVLINNRVAYTHYEETAKAKVVIEPNHVLFTDNDDLKRIEHFGSYTYYYSTKRLSQVYKERRSKWESMK